MQHAKKELVALLHAAVVSLSLHAYHLATSDRMLDAASDVALDKGADIVLHHFTGER